MMASRVLFPGYGLGLQLLDRLGEYDFAEFKLRLRSTNAFLHAVLWVSMLGVHSALDKTHMGMWVEWWSECARNAVSAFMAWL